jgi:hypothetical protein
MNSLQRTRFASKFQSAKDKISKNPLVLEQLLSGDQLREVLEVHGEYRERFFSPTTTLWIFINQILNPDHSCRAAVAHFISTLKSKTCSLATGGYCQARKRLKEEMLRSLFLTQAQNLQSYVKPDWLWKGRNTRLTDGATVSMPDTKDNQNCFPGANKQRQPMEFPIARVVVVICKATGVLIDAAIGTYQGKGSGETSLLKQMLSSFKAGDINIFDRYYAGFFCFAGLMNRRVDCVSRQHHLRKAQVTKKLGENDHVFKVQKPKRPTDMSLSEYQSYPPEITLRRVKVIVDQPGFRTNKMEVITSLIDESFLAQEIAELYRYRWFVEVDIRVIKSVMGMNILRGQSAEMIRKEIWAYFLAYNLVRAVIMDAALLHNKDPRSISFKAALQMFFSFRSQMTQTKLWSKLYSEILKQIKTQIVGDRPNRYEPRAKKRRPPPHVAYLKVPREQARQNCLKQAS